MFIYKLEVLVIMYVYLIVVNGIVCNSNINIIVIFINIYVVVIKV